MKVAIIRDTNNKPVGLWWHYSEQHKGCIELVKAYEGILIEALADPAALNVDMIRACMDDGVLVEMISRPAGFVELVEIEQRLQVASHED